MSTWCTICVTYTLNVHILHPWRRQRDTRASKTYSSSVNHVFSLGQRAHSFYPSRSKCPPGLPITSTSCQEKPFVGSSILQTCNGTCLQPPDHSGPRFLLLSVSLHCSQPWDSFAHICLVPLAVHTGPCCLGHTATTKALLLEYLDILALK